MVGHGGSTGKEADGQGEMGGGRDVRDVCVQVEQPVGAYIRRGGSRSAGKEALELFH